MDAQIKKFPPINLGLPEPKLVLSINKRLHKCRMELVTAAAVLGDVINYGHWFVRARSKATPQNPSPRSYLVVRRVTPLTIATNLNAGQLPK